METTVIIHQMIILFMMIGLGFILNKAHILGDHIDGGITKLILYCTLPAMILNSVLTKTGPREYATILKFLAIAIVMYLSLCLIAIPVTKLIRVPANVRGLYMFLIIFGNVGFMGFPLIEALFGTESVLYAGIFNMIFNLVAYSYGVIIVSRDSNPDGGNVKISAKTFLSPGISVSVLALIIYFLNIPVPDVVGSVVNYVGNLTTPLAMMMIGSTLAKMNPKEVFLDKRFYIYVLVRNIVLPLLFIPVVKFLIKDELLLHITYIMLIMPAANTAVLYAKEYKSDEKFAAGCVFISTLLSIIIIPLLLTIAF